MRNIFIKKSLCVIIFLLFSQIFFAQNKNEQDKLKWLLGLWENQTQKGTVYEKWTFKNDINEYLGKSYIIKNNDTLLLETIRIAYINDSLYYVPKVTNQNEGKEIYFKIKFLEENLFIFENRKHDFPQIILYTQIKNDSLRAEISGIINNKEKRIIFPMKKIK